MAKNDIDDSEQAKKKNGFKNPSPYFIILILIILSVVATWIIPSGEYDRVIDEATGREVVDPESFRYIERTPVGLFDALVAIPIGIKNQVGIISFIFIVSGAIAVIKETGAIDAGIIKLVDKFKGRDIPLLIVTMIICSLLGSLLGFAQEMIPFIAIGIALASGLGYDRVVGFHIVRTATWIGFAASTMNPFVVTVAQEMAELPLLSGMGYRVIVYVVFMIISGVFFLRYAKKVKKDPSKSILYGYESEVDPKQFEVEERYTTFTTRHKLVLLIFVAGLILLAYGAVKFDWGTNEMGAVLFGISIICGFIGGFGPNQIAQEFSKGMGLVTGGALIAGFTGAIAVILNQGQILDTMIHGLSVPLANVSGVATAVGMMIMYSFINFFIGSAAGRAAATLPIMIPLSDILGITRQTAVLAFIIGGGITNMLWPNMIYVLAFGDIPYDRWFKHIWKLVVYLMIAGAILVAIAHFMSYGPF